MRAIQPPLHYVSANRSALANVDRAEERDAIAPGAILGFGSGAIFIAIRPLIAG